MQRSQWTLSMKNLEVRGPLLSSGLVRGSQSAAHRPVPPTTMQHLHFLLALIKNGLVP